MSKTRRWTRNLGNFDVEYNLYGDWKEIKTKDGPPILYCCTPADKEWEDAFDDDDPAILERLIEERYGNDDVELVDWNE